MFNDIQQLIEEKIKAYCSANELALAELKWTAIPFSGEWGISTSFFQTAANEAKLGKGNKVPVPQKAQEIAEQIRAEIGSVEGVSHVEAVKGYLNVYFRTSDYARRVVDEVLASKSDFGRGAPKNERVMVEYAQPNTHHSFHIGHYRNTILGVIQGVGRDRMCSTAYESVGGVVVAMAALARGELARAFCFIGAGGHHAGKETFWGACCFNDVVIALRHVREISPLRRLAIVDTDAHHGDGTRQLIRDDPEVLHLCFCGDNFSSPDGTKIDVDVYQVGRQADPDQEYLAAVQAHLPRVLDFKPDLLVWYYGFDTHRNDYGSIGLTEKVYFQICRLMVEIAADLGIPLQVVLGGGSLAALATATIPGIIRRLVED